MSDPNLPPGVTQAMIDEHFGSDETEPAYSWCKHGYRWNEHCDECDGITDAEGYQVTADRNADGP